MKEASLVSHLAAQTGFAASFVKEVQLFIIGSPYAEFEQLSRYVVYLPPHDYE